MNELALFLHIVSAVAFFSGAAVAGVCSEKARRCATAGEVAALLGAARTGALLVMAGSAGVLVFGLWLVDLRARSLSEGWLAGSLLLLVVALALGAAGGRVPRRARRLAEDGGGGAVTPELRALLEDARSRWLNYGAAAAGLAILALMIWKPGAG